jgi:hypothetical protein
MRNTKADCNQIIIATIQFTTLPKTVKIMIYKSVILPGSICEQGTEENIWTERNEVVGGWRKLHNEELHSLYSCPKKLEVSYQGGFDGQAI